jgi:hypothetical protein
VGVKAGIEKRDSHTSTSETFVGIHSEWRWQSLIELAD